MRIYFFTGTGNSYWTASQLVSLASDSGISANMFAIDMLQRSDIRAGTRDSLTGFIYPTHGFALPWYMLKFILHFPRGKGAVFIVNNRAGMKMGRLFTPGISGIAAHLPMLILILKGYRIAGTLPLDNPSNWISIHPGIKQKVVNSIFERRIRDIHNFGDRIFKNLTCFPLKYLLFIPLDILLIPISLAYLFFGRFILARSYFSSSSCDGCGICAKRCPVGAISMKKGTPYWSYRCESCMRCSNVCPKKSVNSSIPALILMVWVLSNIASSSGIFKDFWELVENSSGIFYWLIYYTLQWVATLVLSWLIYLVLFYLNKTAPGSFLLSRLTPMFWWRRYIAPGFRGIYKSAKSV